jgi:hypothetical protein
MNKQRNRLVTRDTLFQLANSIADADLAVQSSLVKAQTMLGHAEPTPDDLITEAGQALAQLRSACIKLETFLWTQDRDTAKSRT